jgi:hypothetical protein
MRLSPVDCHEQQLVVCSYADSSTWGTTDQDVIAKTLFFACNLKPAITHKARASPNDLGNTELIPGGTQREGHLDSITYT